VSTTSDSSPVLVIGGGIAGLSTALALSRKGQVIEQAAEFKEILRVQLPGDRRRGVPRQPDRGGQRRLSRRVQ
jgi:thioredoxin reductase